MVKRPPSGIASRALIAKFSRTSSICVGSTNAGHNPSVSTVSMRTVAPIVRNSISVASLTSRPFQLLAAARQGPARLDDVRDVGAGAEPSDSSAIIANRRGARLEPAILAVGTTDAQFQIIVIPASHRRHPAFPNPLPIL